MALKEPISLSKLLSKPIVFTLDNSVVDMGEQDLIYDDENDDIPEVKKTPWLYSFDKLKETMTKIPNHDIYKRVVIEGSGEMMGTKKCRIQWSYSVFFEKEEHSYDSSFFSGNSVKTSLYDELLPGLWYSVETMRKGEESHFIINYRLMFGELGHMLGDVKVKPKADVLLVAKLIDFREVGCANACSTLSEDELRQFSVVKEKIVDMMKKVYDFYRKGLYSRATAVNMEIIQRLQYCNTENDDEEKERTQLLADVYAKYIECCIKMEDYKRAVSMVDELGRISDIHKNITVLINAAIAHSKIDDDYSQSIKLLRIAQKLDPKNECVNSTLADIQKEQDKYKNETKHFLQRAFQTKPQQQAKQVKPKIDMNAKKIEVSEIRKEFDKLAIGSSVEVIGHSSEELKKLREDAKNDPNYEMQSSLGTDGEFKHFIKKLA